MKLRIFIVDDEECIRDSLMWHLSEQGHEVICAASPFFCPVYSGENCEHVHSCGDILFVDQNMPGLKGLDFVKHMKKKGCKGLVNNVVVISGALTKAEVSNAKMLGCLLVQKPITLAEVDELVDNMSKNIDPNRLLDSIE